MRTRRIEPFNAQIYIFASTILGAVLWLGWWPGFLGILWFRIVDQHLALRVV